MSKDRQKAFDTSLYKELPPTLLGKSLTEDVAGYVLENRDGPIEERINIREFKIADGKIIDEETGDNIFGNWKPIDALGEKECASALLFYTYILDNPTGSLVVSISPSGGISPYKEARINVGYKEGDDKIVYYGIPSRLNPEECKKLGINMLKFSFLDLKIDLAEDLRDKTIPILLPQDEDPWQFLKSHFPLDSKAWDSIISGLPKVLKAEARAAAKEVAVEIAPAIKYARVERDFIIAGAYMERKMEQAGWKIDQTGFGCPGASNRELLSDGNTKDAYGNIRTTTSGEGKFVHNCGNCGAPIFAFISSGYICPRCRGVYKGC